MNKYLLKAWDALLGIFQKIEWPRTAAVFNKGIYYKLTETDHDIIRQLLKENYLIILTRKGNHLTSFLISVAGWWKTKTWAHYAHALMNVEGDLDGHVGFKLIEATGATGVSWATFMQVFNCDSVALLKPRDVPMEEWTAVLDRVKSKIGTPYDNLFDIVHDNAITCVELVYIGLKSMPDYEARFPKLITLLEKYKNNLTPQMLYDTGELDIVFEVRR